MADHQFGGLDRALTTVAGGVVAAFAAMSSAATIAYVVGYLNRKMYLSIFGAGWVLSELKTTEVLISSVPILGLLTVLLGLAFQGVTNKRLRWANMEIVHIAYGSGAALLILDLTVGNRLLDATRAVVYGAITGALLFATITLARLGFVALSENSVSARFSAVSYFALALIAGCVLAPCFMGISEAFAICSNKLKDLPTVVAPTVSADRLALLASSSERVYCLEWSESDDLQVLPVAWDKISSITNRRRSVATWR